MNKFNLSEQAIAEAAYYIWQKNGCPANSSLQDWNAAINQLTLANAQKKSLKKTISCKTLSAAKKSPAKKCAAKKAVAKKSK